MVLVHEAKILIDGSLLMVVETSQNNKIQSLVVWDKDDFGSYEKSHDLSAYLSKTSNKESVLIPAEENPLDLSVDIVFFEVVSSEDSYNQARGAIYSLARYYKCMMDSLFKEHDMGSTSGCSINGINTGSIAVLIDLLITSFEQALLANDMEVVKLVLSRLDKVCKTSTDGCGCNSTNLTDPCNKFKQY